MKLERFLGSSLPFSWFLAYLIKIALADVYYSNKHKKYYISGANDLVTPQDTYFIKS
jgi:hypothetical protein